MNKNDFVIEQVKEFSPEIADAVRNLVKQLVPNNIPLTDAEFKEILESPQSFLFIAREMANNKVAGMIMATIFRIPDSKKMYIDDVIVDEHFRGRGIATLIFEKVTAVAKEQHASYLLLTSNSKRTAGIRLYEKLGFKKRDTNVYRLEIDHEEA